MDRNEQAIRLSKMCEDAYDAASYLDYLVNDLRFEKSVMLWCGAGRGYAVFAC